MFLPLIAYILLWGGIVYYYGFDISIIVGGAIILICTIISMIKTQKDNSLMDKDSKKKHKKYR